MNVFFVSRILRNGYFQVRGIQINKYQTQRQPDTLTGGELFMETERLTLTIPEAAELLGLGRSLTYDLANRGELPVIRFGKRIMVSKPALMKMLNQCEKEGTKWENSIGTE